MNAWGDTLLFNVKHKSLELKLKHFSVTFVMSKNNFILFTDTDAEYKKADLTARDSSEEKEKAEKIVEKI